MRHGFGSIKLTSGARAGALAGALAFTLLAVPVTSQAAPALALADTGPGDARRQVDAAIVLDLGDGYTDNQATLQKVHYRRRHNRACLTGSIASSSHATLTTRRATTISALRETTIDTPRGVAIGATATSA